MILDSFVLDGIMSKEKQNLEILRIKHAKPGTILFTEKIDSDYHSVIKTLLTKSDVSWIESCEGMFIFYQKR